MLYQNQSMKELAINESLNKIDFLINRAVVDIVATLPTTPSEGDLYILKDDSIALYLNNKWEVFKPKKQMMFYVLSKKSWAVYDNGWTL